MEMWSALKKSLPHLLEEAPPDALMALTKELSEMRISVCAKHPDACQICSAEIVPSDARICDCDGRVCYSCAGKTTTLACPRCNSNERLLQLVATDKILVPFSTAVKFKPQLARVQAAPSLDGGDEERQPMVLDSDQPEQKEQKEPRGEPRVNEKESERPSNSRRRRLVDDEAKEEEPPAQRRAPADGALVQVQAHQQEQVKESKAKEIAALLKFCSKHGDQRPFGELLADINKLRDWNQAGLNTCSADSMDLNTIKEQWFLTANIAGISDETRFICYLRQGEFYERLSNLCDANGGGLEQPDEQGNAQHYSNALDYLRRVFNYRKKDELQLRACHQFFIVWKEWHPIIAVAQSQFGWRQLRDVLSRKRLLSAVRTFKAEQALAQLPPPLPAPLPYSIPQQFREYPRPGFIPASMQRASLQRQQRADALAIVAASASSPPPPQDEGEAPPVVTRVSLVLDSWYQPDFVSNPDDLYERITNEVDFTERYDLPPFGMFGKEAVLPRDKAFQGDVQPDGSFPVYRYEKDKDHYPIVLPWTPCVLELRDLIEKKTGQRCNHVVINRYNNGDDYISYHNDKTLDFLEGTHVFTISLGAARKFRIHNKDDRIVAEQVLEPGSLNKLGWETNKEHKHSIIKEPSVSDVRYGLTFRTIKTFSPGSAPSSPCPPSTPSSSSPHPSSAASLSPASSHNSLINTLDQPPSS